METERLIFLVLAITGGCLTAPQGQRPWQLWPEDKPWNVQDPNQLGGEEGDHEAIVELAKFVRDYLARDVEKNRQLILDNQAVLQKLAVNNPVASLEVQRSEATVNASKLLFPKSKFFKKVQTRVLDYDEDLSLDPLPNSSDPNVIPSQDQLAGNHNQLGQEKPSDYQDMGSESLSLPLDPLGGNGNSNLFPRLERYHEHHDLDPDILGNPELGSGVPEADPDTETLGELEKPLDWEGMWSGVPEAEPETETEAEPELEGPGLESHFEEPDLGSGVLLLEVPRGSIFAPDPLPGWDDPNLL